LYNALTVPFNPTQISGCSLWLDAADSSTVTLSGSSVSQWNDKSGNGRNAVQGPSPNQRPTYSNNGMVFNGTNTSLNVTNAGSIARNRPGNTVFAVRKFNNASGTGFVFAFSAGETTATRSLIAQQTGTPVQSRMGGRRLDTDAFKGLDNAWSSNTTVVSLVQNWSTGLWEGFEQGSNLGQAWTTTTTTGNSSDTNSSFVYIGCGLSGSDLFFNGILNELVVYNSALSTSQRQQVEGYLAWKWGLRTSLPTSHPYSKFNPS
jgi:hypothetical protein